MEFSWNLFEDTFNKVGDVLGDTISDINFEQQVMDQLVTSDCEIPMDDSNNERVMCTEIDTNEEKNSDVFTDVQFNSLDPAVSENILKVTEEMSPLSRSRSNSWPKRKFEPRSVKKFSVKVHD